LNEDSNSTRGVETSNKSLGYNSDDEDEKQDNTKSPKTYKNSIPLSSHNHTQNCTVNSKKLVQSQQKVIIAEHLLLQATKEQPKCLTHLKGKEGDWSCLLVDINDPGKHPWKEKYVQGVEVDNYRECTSRSYIVSRSFSEFVNTFIFNIIITSQPNPNVTTALVGLTSDVKFEYIKSDVSESVKIPTGETFQKNNQHLYRSTDEKSKYFDIGISKLFDTDTPNHFDINALFSQRFTGWGSSLYMNKLVTSFFKDLFDYIKYNFKNNIDNILEVFL
jgi:hypothetical protein